MIRSLPESPHQLRWILVKRLGLAGAAIGALAGAAAYVVEARHAERTAFDQVATTVRHFDSPAMQDSVRRAAFDDHPELRGVLEQSRFIGFRIFNSGGTVLYETWKGVPPAALESIGTHRHAWPAPHAYHSNWNGSADRRLIQVVVPLTGSARQAYGYFEGIYRLDPADAGLLRARPRNAALNATAAVLATALLLYPLLLGMTRRALTLSQSLLEANLALMQSLGNAVAKRDSGTDAHNFRVTLYAVALAEASKLPEKDIADLVAGAFLHDVGKIGIPDHILLKPGKLSESEFEIMKSHTVIGLDIVAGNSWLAGAAPVIRHHHERFDGAGYPDGLAGSAIPRCARLFAVVDVFDALTSARPYKAPMPLAEALEILQRDARAHLDPDAVAMFVRIAPATYESVARAGEDELRLRMQEVLRRYFRNGTIGFRVS